MLTSRAGTVPGLESALDFSGQDLPTHLRRPLSGQIDARLYVPGHLLSPDSLHERIDSLLRVAARLGQTVTMRTEKAPVRCTTSATSLSISFEMGLS